MAKKKTPGNKRSGKKGKSKSKSTKAGSRPRPTKKKVVKRYKEESTTYDSPGEITESSSYDLEEATFFEGKDEGAERVREFAEDSAEFGDEAIDELINGGREDEIYRGGADGKSKALGHAADSEEGGDEDDDGTIWSGPRITNR